MKRYHMVTTSNGAGGYTEFVAADDDDARARAARRLYGARLISLAEVTRPGGYETLRPIPIGEVASD